MTLLSLLLSPYDADFLLQPRCTPPKCSSAAQLQPNLGSTRECVMLVNISESVEFRKAVVCCFEVPGSGSDCLVAELDRGQATARFWAPNRKRQATALSVAAHTLYEKSHPHLFGLPGGVLSTKHAVFKQRGRVVEVEGTKLTRVPPAVKLEGR